MFAAWQTKVDGATAAIGLPLAVSLFRAFSVAANVAVTACLMKARCVLVRSVTLIIRALIAGAVSVGAVGLEAEVSLFAIIAPGCIAVGMPVTPLPLLLSIETLADVFRMLGNVTDDLAVMQMPSVRRVTGIEAKLPNPFYRLSG